MWVCPLDSRREKLCLASITSYLMCGCHALPWESERCAEEKDEASGDGPGLVWLLGQTRLPSRPVTQSSESRVAYLHISFFRPAGGLGRSFLRPWQLGEMHLASLVSSPVSSLLYYFLPFLRAQSPVINPSKRKQKKCQIYQGTKEKAKAQL